MVTLLILNKIIILFLFFIFLLLLGGFSFGFLNDKLKIIVAYTRFLGEFSKCRMMLGRK